MTKHLRFSRDPKTKGEEDLSIDKFISARQVFSAFRRSNEGCLMVSGLMRRQLYLCPYCKCSLSGKSYEVDHIIPITLIPSWSPQLVTSESNLMVLCQECNKKKSSKLEGYYRLVFHREGFIKEPLWSSDIYKEYGSMVKKLVKGNYSDIGLQQMWNRDVLILNRPLSQVVDERLVVEVEVINNEDSGG